ncbi:MAG TPA: CDP-alcohol phosphatidyltransferase family protein [Bacteroidota bacterium]|nr:CDP-alcohol phosphatidyltransferase family protein [Bacteroidota bacterium]
MKREFLTLPNILSISRALLAIPFICVMLLPSAPMRAWGVAILVLGIVTDRLDGELARARKEETEWGRILDPLADKIAAATVALVLLRLAQLPLWFVIGLLGRDLLILCGGIYVKARRGLILPSNVYGKWTIGIIGLLFFSLMVEAPEGISTVLLFASASGLLVSFVAYVARFVEVIGSPRTT